MKTFVMIKCKMCNKKINIRCESELNKHKGYCKSCCKKKRPFEALYNVLRRGAKHRNIPVSLTYEEFVSFTKQKYCEYCGSDVEWQETTHHGNSGRTNLDRKDNQQGYCLNNLVVCCFRCNEIKGAKLTHGEMFYLAQKIKHREVGKIKTFTLLRRNDESKVSGTGYVLQGVVFPEGECVVKWCSDQQTGSIEIWPSYNAFIKIHVTSHPTNQTRIEFSDGSAEEY